MGKLTFTAEPGKQEVAYTRFFAAPRAQVFKSFIDPQLKPQWWGMRRSTTIVDKTEVKVGGIWRYINRDANKQEFAFRGVYHEVTAPERLVNTFEFEIYPKGVSLDLLSFKDRDGGTMLSVKSVYLSVEDRDVMVGFGMETMLTDSFDRLEELLAKNKVPAGT